jgi:hypothetical protein
MPSIYNQAEDDDTPIEGQCTHVPSQVPWVADSPTGWRRANAHPIPVLTLTSHNQRQVADAPALLLVRAVPFFSIVVAIAATSALATPPRCRRRAWKRRCRLLRRPSVCVVCVWLTYPCFRQSLAGYEAHYPTVLRFE